MGVAFVEEDLLFREKGSGLSAFAYKGSGLRVLLHVQPVPLSVHPTTRIVRTFERPCSQLRVLPCPYRGFESEDFAC